MLIVGFVPSAECAQSVVAWCRRIANSHAGTDDQESTGLDLASMDGASMDGAAEGANRIDILCWEQHATDATTRTAVTEALDGGSARVSVITTPDPIESISEYCRNEKADILVGYAFKFGRDDVVATTSRLVRAAPCRAFVPLFGDRPPADTRRVLVIGTGSVHDRAALDLAVAISEDNADISVATIEKDLGEGTAEAGERELERLLHDTSADTTEIDRRVIVDSQPVRGILRAIEDHDLVLVPPDLIDRVRSLEEPLGGATVALLKRAPPLTLSALPGFIPRINPADYGELVQNLRQGSRWNADFVVMLALASAIASLGLLQNSPAVVIGSMLLAPLMTPMIGLGLALAQANVDTARLCGRSIGLGFAMTLVISFIAALITPLESLAPEVLARGEPNVLDLGIALCAAVAASFALARPGIAGAVAGVAIATALVPPVCAIGISLSEGLVRLVDDDPYTKLTAAHATWNGIGASALFLTNLIAIIFASFLTFRAMGVTSRRAPPRDRHRARLIVAVIVAAILILAFPLRLRLGDQVRSGRTQSLASPLSMRTTTALQDFLEDDVDGRDVELILAARSNLSGRIYLWIASEGPDLPIGYADELRRIVRDESAEEDAEITVFALRMVWKSGVVTPDGP